MNVYQKVILASDKKNKQYPNKDSLTNFKFELNLSIRIENSTTLLYIIQKTNMFGFWNGFLIFGTEKKI